MTPPPALRLTGQHRIDARPLFDVDMTLAAGAWTCLLGPSGVGKSTVLRLLLGLETGGAFDGTITASDGQPLAGRISYMAQSDLLLPWLTVIENIMIGDRLRGTTPDRGRASAMLERVGLQDHAHKKPAALSGGMRQRAALARTLLEDRAVVFLDEPFSALDAGTRAAMQELAVELLHGRTVLLVTHDPAEAARLADHILILSATGVQSWPVPALRAPRPVTAPEVWACQSALLSHLRGVPA